MHLGTAEAIATCDIVSIPADKLHKVILTPTSISLVLCSCVIGVAISYLGWRARSLVTATCYTVLGVANKMLTVLVNMLIWDKHASLGGVLWLCVCLAGATAYQQAPLREDKKAQVTIGLLNSDGADSQDGEDDPKTTQPAQR